MRSTVNLFLVLVLKKRTGISALKLLDFHPIPRGSVINYKDKSGLQAFKRKASLQTGCICQRGQRVRNLYGGKVWKMH